MYPRQAKGPQGPPGGDRGWPHYLPEWADFLRSRLEPEEPARRIPTGFVCLIDTISYGAADNCLITGVSRLSQVLHISH